MMTDTCSELIAELNKASWEPMPGGMIAKFHDFTSDEISALEEVLIFRALRPAVVDTPDGYEVGFYQDDCDRLIAAGLRLSGRQGWARARGTN